METADKETTLALPLWGCVVWFEDDELISADEGEFQHRGKNAESACNVSAPPCQDFLDKINRHYGTALRMEDFAGR